jgi:hypothetical protein
MEPKKETLMCIAKCKRRDGKILDYYVHRLAAGVVIIGPNLERHRCHLDVTSIDAAQMEIAKICHVEVISINTCGHSARANWG